MPDLESLTGDGKRPLVHDKQLVFKLPASIKEIVTQEAARQKVSESALARRALGEYLQRLGY